MTIPERALYGFDMAVKQTAVHTTTLKCDKYQPFFGLYTNIVVALRQLQKKGDNNILSLSLTVLEQF